MAFESHGIAPSRAPEFGLRTYSAAHVHGTGRTNLIGRMIRTSRKTR